MDDDGLRAFGRRDAGYERARSDAMWNARLPERYPAVIVQARDVYDVVAAVRRAKREGLRVAVRSGGHSWAGNHVREGGMLLDVSRLDAVSVDAAAMRATTGPGRAGHELAAALGREGLFFPTGHCEGVCVGGYLLQGGFGWNGRALGVACQSVEAVDVVTADGDLVRASATEHPDLYWSARGAGPGFFGVVTRFHLRAHPKPAASGFALQSYPMSMLEELLRWARAVGPSVPASVELQLVASRRAARVDGPGVEVFAPVFADSLRGALRDLEFMREAPHVDRARLSLPFVPATLGMMYRAVMAHYPSGHRYAVDNLWTHAPVDDLLPPLRAAADALPPAPSHLLWLNWAPPPTRPDMAFSVEDEVYLALYGAWRHASDDHRHASWAVEHARAMEPLASGCQLADENLGQRPARFVSEANLARLDRARAEYDPDGRFFPWMGRP